MRKQEAERESKREKEEDLFYLAEHGSAEEMQALLDNGVDLELTEPAYHRTPLMVAAASNTADVVLTLLNAVEDRKTELRVTAPVRTPSRNPWPGCRAAAAAAPPPPPARPAAHVWSCLPAAGRLQCASLGGDEQQRDQGRGGRVRAAQVLRGRVAPDQEWRHGARPCDTIQESRCGGTACARVVQEFLGETRAPVLLRGPTASGRRARAPRSHRESFARLTYYLD